MIQPTEDGFYGEFGGAFVPEMLHANVEELRNNYKRILDSREFKEELGDLLKNYVGRPTPLYKASNLSAYFGANIYLKREDLNHTGAHKINNALGQILLARMMGKTHIIAETGAGQHGVAAATASALMGMPCKVFMGEIDVERQALNVRRMKLLGAEVIPTNLGSRTLKDAVDAALGYYIEHPDSFYCLGSQVGPHPYPRIVGYFQSVIGNEARQQILEEEGRLPDHIFAAVGGGSNAIGLFSGFLADESVKIHGGEGGGSGTYPSTAATLTFGKPTVFQGTMSYCLVDEAGNPIPSQSIAAGLDYPGISPQHALLKDTGRADYAPVTDAEAVEAYNLLSRLEGITPAIESSHAVAIAIKTMKGKGQLAIVNLSGRGDKDVEREM